jgi:hypothetical protein
MSDKIKSYFPHSSFAIDIRLTAGLCPDLSGKFKVTLRKRALLFVSAASLAVLGVCSGSRANHAWGPYHWARTLNPFSLQLGNNLSGDWPTYLTYIVADWNTPANAALNYGANA